MFHFFYIYGFFLLLCAVKSACNYACNDNDNNNNNKNNNNNNNNNEREGKCDN